MGHNYTLIRGYCADHWCGQACCAGCAPNPDNRAPILFFYTRPKRAARPLNARRRPCNSAGSGSTWGTWGPSTTPTFAPPRAPSVTVGPESRCRFAIHTITTRPSTRWRTPARRSSTRACRLKTSWRPSVARPAAAAVHSRGAHYEHTLTQTLAAACGSPCRHDYLLRTESARGRLGGARARLGAPRGADAARVQCGHAQGRSIGDCVYVPRAGYCRPRRRAPL